MDKGSPEDDFKALEPPTEDTLEVMPLLYNADPSKADVFDDPQHGLGTLVNLVMLNNTERYAAEFYRTAAISMVEGFHAVFEVDKEYNFRQDYRKIRDGKVMSERGNADAWIIYWEDEYKPK